RAFRSGWAHKPSASEMSVEPAVGSTWRQGGPHTWRMQERAPVPPPPPAPRPLIPRGLLREEVVIVLALSLLASAVYAIIDLATAPLHGIAVGTYPAVPFATQLADIAFSLVPVWLVVYLLRRSGESPRTIGYTTDGIGLQSARDSGSPRSSARPASGSTLPQSHSTSIASSF